MLDRDYRDIIAGLGLAVAGAAAATYALIHYSMGTITRMGPGMMPVSLGVLLTIFGLAIALPGLFRKGDAVELRWRPIAALSVAIIAFAICIETVGFVPAVFVTTVIATFAETRVRFGSALLLGAGLAALTWAIFIAGLNLPITALDWPF